MYFTMTEKLPLPLCVMKWKKGDWIQWETHLPQSSWVRLRYKLVRLEVKFLLLLLVQFLFFTTSILNLLLILATSLALSGIYSRISLGFFGLDHNFFCFAYKTRRKNGSGSVLFINKLAAELINFWYWPKSCIWVIKLGDLIMNETKW